MEILREETTQAQASFYQAFQRIELPIYKADNALPSIMCHFAMLPALFLIRLLCMEQRMAMGEAAGRILKGARSVYKWNYEDRYEFS
jgi:hypothetical protein